MRLLCGGGSLCVHAGVRAHTRVPVCRCHVHTGAQLLLHTCAPSQVQTCQPVLSYPFPPRSWLGSCWAGHWLVGQSLAILVHVTSDPEHACPWLGLTSSLSPVCGDVWLHEQGFCVPAGRCVSLHVCSVIDLSICVSPRMGVQGVSGCGWCASGGRECVCFLKSYCIWNTFGLGRYEPLLVREWGQRS